MRLLKQRKLIIIALGIIAAGILFYATGFGILPKAKEEKKEEKEQIGLGIVASSKETIDKYQAFVDYLNQYSDDQWVLVPLKDYGSFITQMSIGQIKAGFMGSAVGYRMIKEELASPVARGEKDGISVYYGYIFTRKDSGLGAIEDLKDKKFAYVDPFTSAGFFFPKYLLKTKGYDPEQFFKAVSFLGTHEKAIQAVLEGKFDGGAAKDSAWRKLAKENPSIENDMQIIAKDGPFPEQTLLLNVQFGQKEIQELQELMLKMTDSPEGRQTLSKMGLDRFIVTKEDDSKRAKEIYESNQD